MKTVSAPGEAILNRLRYPARFIMVSLIMIVPMATTGYLLYSEVEDHIQSLASERLGLRYITRIRPLIQHIPEHRGMSGAFLNGDETFRRKMLSNQGAVDEMFAKLAEADNEMGTELETGSRVGNLNDEWNTLKSKVFTLTPKESFIAQTELVSNIIGLIAHVADTSGLVLDPHIESHLLMDLVVTQMPILTEGMGQSRGIASGAAARGRVSRQERDQLVIRLARIRLTVEKLNSSLEAAYHENHRFKEPLSGHGEAASKSVAVFSRLMQELLLDAESITVSTVEIFSISSMAINAVFDTYDAIIPELDRLFSERIQEESQTQMIALVLIVGALLLVFIVSVAFYKALNRFKTTLDMTKDGVFLFTPGSLKFSYVNQSAMEQVGCSEAELMDMNPMDITPDYDEATFQELITPLVEGQQRWITFETNQRHKDGHMVPVEILLQYIDPKGEPARFVAIVRNIADRKVMQELVRIRTEELQESQERFAIAVEGSGDGIWDWDINSGTMNFSHFYAEMLGYSENELSHHIDTWTNSVHPDDMPGVQQDLQDYLEGRIPIYAVELRLRCKDGSYKWILRRGKVVSRDDEGKPVRMIGIHSDITPRKSAEATLRETEERNRLLLESVGEGIYGMGADGKATFVNHAVCEMLGYTEEELIGQPIHSLIHHSYSDGSPCLLEDCNIYAPAIDGATYKVDDEVLWNKDGSSFPVEYTSMPVRKDGAIIGSVVTFRDVSERIIAEQALIAARDEAERASRAESEFLSSMSHELRTPMNAILGFGQILECDEALNEHQIDSVEEILQAGQHLLELINEVLDLAKIESGRIDLSLEPVEVHPIIDECLSLVGGLADKRGIRFSHSGQEGAVVRADYTRLKQVLLNLLSNAIKYNREGGGVKIEVQPEDAERLRIGVTDTGPGIPAEHRAELFQPFNRLDAKNSEIEGTGIGLTITRNIVELMGGSVDVESEVGVGSSFWIELPLESLPVSNYGHEQAAVDSAIPAQSGGAAEHTVLYIEDNPSNLKLVAQILSRRKHIKLLTAHAPELGIELALTHRPELILLDINMPGMDGYQVLEVFKAEASLKAIPVVAITANAMPRDIKRGKAAGFADYLTKPLDVARFLAVLDSNLGIDE
jgi:PAS domain S-box-containing protein